MHTLKKKKINRIKKKTRSYTQQSLSTMDRLWRNSQQLGGSFVLLGVVRWVHANFVGKWLASCPVYIKVGILPWNMLSTFTFDRTQIG